MISRAARSYVVGTAEGSALVLAVPLSFWGGIDVESGRIIDRSHPAHGGCIARRVLVMPGGRGSSSSSSVLAETIRRGTGPIAVVLATADPILTVGALIAESLYGIRCPIVTCSIEGLASDQRIRVVADEERALVHVSRR